MRLPQVLEIPTPDSTTTGKAAPIYSPNRKPALESGWLFRVQTDAERECQSVGNFDSRYFSGPS